MALANEIYTLLSVDSALKTLLGGTATDSKIYPYSAELSKVPCIVYILTPVADDAVKQRNRLELRIIGKSLATITAIDERCRTLLLTIGDKTLSSTVLNVEVNGGGNLSDTATQTTQTITYYNITNRR